MSGATHVKRAVFLGAPLSLAGCAFFFDFDGYQPSSQAHVVMPESGAPPARATIELEAIAALRVRRGTTTTAPIRIVRSGPAEDVTLRVAEHSNGIRIDDVVVPASADQAELSVVVDTGATLGSTTIVVTAVSGAAEDSNVLPITVVASELDSTFGEDGTVLLNGTVEDIAIADDGGVLVVESTNTDWSVDRITDAPSRVAAHNIGRDDLRVAFHPSGDHIVAIGQGDSFVVQRYAGAEFKTGWAYPIANTFNVRLIAQGDRLYYVGGVVPFGESPARLLLATYDTSQGVSPVGALTQFTSDAGIDIVPADALLSGQRFVTCTTETKKGLPSALVLRRFQTDGGLDPSFGDAGSTSPLLGESVACAGLVSVGDRIVAVGNIQSPTVNRAEERIVLFATTLEGQPSTAVGDAGIAIESTLAHAAGIAADPRTGAIYVAVEESLRDGFVGAVWAYTRSGERDLAFGDTAKGGAFTLSLKSALLPRVIRVLPDGRLLVAGGATEALGPGFLVRIRP